MGAAERCAGVAEGQQRGSAAAGRGRGAALRRSGRPSAGRDAGPQSSLRPLPPPPSSSAARGAADGRGTGSGREERGREGGQWWSSQRRTSTCSRAEGGDCLFRCPLHCSGAAAGCHRSRAEERGSSGDVERSGGAARGCGHPRLSCVDSGGGSRIRSVDFNAEPAAKRRVEGGGPGLEMGRRWTSPRLTPLGRRTWSPTRLCGRRVLAPPVSAPRPWWPQRGARGLSSSQLSVCSGARRPRSDQNGRRLTPQRLSRLSRRHPPPPLPRLPP